MSPRFRRVAVIVGAAGVLAAGAGCGGSAATSSSSPAPGAAGQPQQQGSAPGAPDLSALATKLGVSTARLQQAMQAARPSSPSTDAARPIRPPRWPRRSASPRPRCGPRCRRRCPRAARRASPANPASRASRTSSSSRRRASRRHEARPRAHARAGAARPRLRGARRHRGPRRPAGSRLCRPSRPGARAALRAPHRPVGRGDLEPQAVATWLAAVRAAGMAPHVAFEHLASDRCPQRPCTAPTGAQYGAAVRRFVARFPQVRTYTTWNEANTQASPSPTTRRPSPPTTTSCAPRARAARSSPATSSTRGPTGAGWSASCARAPRRRGCGACTTTGDVTYGPTTGVDTVLATVPGALWIEETGGLVALRNAAGAPDCSPTRPPRRARSIAPSRIAAANPRIARMYVYQWRANATDRFDAGSCAPTAAPGRATRRSPVTSPRSARCAGGRRGRRGAPGACSLRATCTTSARTCRGRVTVSIAGRRVATRTYRTTARHPTAVLHVDVPRARRTARRVALLVRASRPSFPTQTLDLTVTTPTTRR